MARFGKIFAGTLVGACLLLACATVVADILIGRANPPLGEFVDTSSGRQQVLDVGPDLAPAATAPVIVLLHGVGANLADMRLALVDRLRARYRVIAVDRPGSGWSERRGGAQDGTPRRQAAVLHEILHKLGVTRPILLGHSWSGALVLLAPVAYSIPGRVAWFVKFASMPWLVEAYAHTLAVPTGLLMLDWGVSLVFAPETPPPNYVARASIRLGLRPTAAASFIEDMAGLESIPPSRIARYSQIAVPSVVIAGDRDHIVSTRHEAAVIARQLPHARLITLAGVGHMPQYAQPDRVVAAIAQLLDAMPTVTKSGSEVAGPAATGRP